MSFAMKGLHRLTTAVVAAVGLAACSPLQILNTLSSDPDARVAGGLSYGEGVRRKLDVYAPRNASEAPVVIFFYGGSWNSGSREDYAFVGRALASRGIVAVLADYRVYPEVRYPSFLRDSAQAVAWTVGEIARYGGDAERLFVMGHSAGAYNAAMIALDGRWLAEYGIEPSVFRGWIGLAGPYDFLPIINPDVKPVFHHPDTPADSQPIIHVSGEAPPALLIAARDDDLVNPDRNTAAMSRELRAKHVAVTEIYYDGVSHVTLVASLSSTFRRLAPTLDAIESFVDSGGNQPLDKSVK